MMPGGYVGVSDSMLFEAKKIAFYSEVYKKDFSVELLKECIYYEKIQHPDVVLTQSELETGHYTSELFWVANNLFGMRLAEVRETTAAGEYKHHAKYLHWTDSVKDYKKFQEWYMSIGYDIGDNSDGYLVFLKWIRYATDKRYIGKLIIMGNKEIS
jgi:flagellum-specific peptidoglycan hydrolase FlgJ